MVMETMLDALSNKWWILLLRGIVAILFGILAFTMPGLTLASLVLLYGIYAFVDGIVAIWAGASAHAWGILLLGVLGVLVGIYAFASPGTVATALVFFVGLWAIIRGIFEIVAAVQVRKVIENEWMLIIGGSLSILAGVAILMYPTGGALGIVWLIGTYAIAYGVILLILAFRLHGIINQVRDTVKAHSSAR